MPLCQLLSGTRTRILTTVFVAVCAFPFLSNRLAANPPPEMLTATHSATAVAPLLIDVGSNVPRSEYYDPRQVGTGPDTRLTFSGSAQNETSIVVDPNNPNTIVGGQNDYSLLVTGFAGNGVLYSANGGATWTHHATGVALPTGFTARGGDPCLTFDTQSRVYYGHIALSGTGSPHSSSNGVFVSRSNNGGVTWNATVSVSQNLFTGTTVNFEDKPYIAADHHVGSSFQDRIYLTWTRFYGATTHPAGGVGGGDIMISSSSNGGATWTTPLRLPVPLNVGTGTVGLSFVQGSEPEVASNGDVFVTFWFGGRIEVWRSTNGGASFSQVAQPFGAAFNVASVPTPMPGNTFRVNAFPNIETDPTRPGHVYVVSADDPSNVGSDTEIIFSRSANNGATWTTTVPLNDDTVDCAQIFPWLAVSNKGAIHVIWYDTRNDVANCHLMDVFGAYSIDGGLSFDPNFRVTSASFEPNTGQFTGNTFFGDYNGLASGGSNSFHALWTDTRRGALPPEQEIYYDPIDCDLTALTCPPDQAIAGGSTVPQLTLSGFSIQNNATASRSYNYAVTTTGPGTLNDLGNPASLSGTTPLLAVGGSFAPPNAALDFGAITVPSTQLVVYTVSPTTTPTWTEVCTTTIDIQPPVPVFFQAFDASADANRIELAWDVVGDLEILGFNVYRADEATGSFRILNDTGLLPASERSYRDTDVEAAREYVYRIGAVDTEGEWISLPQTASLKLSFVELRQNTPNPFNPHTSITFVTPSAQHVQLSVYDVRGKLVRTMFNGLSTRGENRIAWDGMNNVGERVSSGVFYYVLTAGTFVETRKMVLLK